jgi:hypothetical protein
VVETTNVVETTHKVETHTDATIPSPQIEEGSQDQCEQAAEKPVNTLTPPEAELEVTSEKVNSTVEETAQFHQLQEDKENLSMVETVLSHPHSHVEEQSNEDKKAPESSETDPSPSSFSHSQETDNLDLSPRGASVESVSPTASLEVTSEPLVDVSLSAVLTDLTDQDKSVGSELQKETNDNVMNTRPLATPLVEASLSAVLENLVNESDKHGVNAHEIPSHPVNVEIKNEREEEVKAEKEEVTEEVLHSTLNAEVHAQ